jgi:hypothetical protein
MSALTIKIPEPIMEPATIMVASNKLKEGLKLVTSSDILSNLMSNGLWYRHKKSPLFFNRLEGISND